MSERDKEVLKSYRAKQTPRKIDVKSLRSNGAISVKDGMGLTTYQEGYKPTPANKGAVRLCEDTTESDGKKDK